MNHVRPHQVFSLVPPNERAFRFFVPTIHCLPAVESAVLVALLKTVAPIKVFEFGTYYGETTRLLLENLPALSDAEDTAPRLFTLDLPATEGVQFVGDDERLAQESLRGTRAFGDSSKAHLVHQIPEDSMSFDPSPYARQFGYIFIDANHKEDYVRSDTSAAFEMLADGPACVLWHDYRNPMYPENTAYLDELSKEIPLFHVEETCVVFHPRGFSVPERLPSRG